MYEIPMCPGPNCPRCKAMHTIIGCGECIARQSRAVWKIAIATWQAGETSEQAIRRVVANSVTK